ncbi:MAG: DUF1624 domain-containing protein [Clostridia bacterium]|nr:DUF1624 domain-containing protein [Clostridia bacterium]
MSAVGEGKTRYYAFDIVRGLSLLLMIGHHLAIDLVDQGLGPAWLLDNFLLKTFQPVFAAAFVALSGASSRFSHDNIRRGLKILACAAVVSLVTYFLGESVFIRFGILHFLGLASLIYHFCWKYIERLRLPGWIWLPVFVAARLAFPRRGEISWLWPLGVYGKDFASADYYPLLPWIFAYFFGIWLADMARSGSMPRWFYTVRCRPLETVSRYSLWIYMLHQPVLMGALYLITRR